MKDTYLKKQTQQKLYSKELVTLNHVVLLSITDTLFLLFKINSKTLVSTFLV